MMRWFIVGVALLSTWCSAWAEVDYRLATDESSVSILGNSSIHAWESSVDSFAVTARFHAEDGALVGVDSLIFIADVLSISSGKKIMDSKTRDALNAEAYPQIRFHAGERTARVYGDTIAVSGQLSLAGVSNDIDVTGTYRILANGDLNVSGTVEIDMTEYGVKPPTAMMGMLKTSPQVQIAYSMLFVPVSLEVKP